MTVSVKGKLWYHIVIKGKNGEPFLTSETYFSKGNALRAARRVAKEFKLKYEA